MNNNDNYIEMKATRNKNGFDVDLQVKPNGCEFFTTEGHLRDCEFGRYVFETENGKLDQIYQGLLKEAWEAGKTGCDDPRGLLKVFREAYEQYHRHEQREIASERRSEASLQRFFEERF
jgi:hypothetical protein